MSAKGLPPAVRLDPLLPLPSTQHSHCKQQAGYDAKSCRPPPSPSYVTIEAPKSMSKTPPISNEQVAQVKPRGLTPIIITPSSSRAHTPVQLLPLLPSLALPQCSSPALGKPKPKRIKIEPKVEPVDLEPLLPTRREEIPRVMAVIDDDEVEKFEERMHVRRDRNTDVFRQLPTPHTTPPTEALSTLYNHSSSIYSPDRGCRRVSEFECASPRTGKTISISPINLGDIHPLSLDPDTQLQADSRCPGRRSEKERDVVERGRKKERGPSRFRHERERHRPAPYDPKSRPGGALQSQPKGSEKCAPRAFPGQLKLGDIAAAAALAMNEANQINSTSGSTCSSAGDSVSSNLISSTSSITTATTTPTAVPPSSASTTMLAQQNMSTPTLTPPQHYNSAPQTPAQQQQTDKQRSKGGPQAGPRPSHAIHAAADEMIQLFSNEFQSQFARERELMQEHFSYERDKLVAGIRREREALEQARAELQSGREQVQREREALRREVEKEIREENETLRTRVEQLQVALDVMQGGRT